MRKNKKQVAKEAETFAQTSPSAEMAIGQVDNGDGHTTPPKPGGPKPTSKDLTSSDVNNDPDIMV